LAKRIVSEVPLRSRRIPALLDSAEAEEVSPSYAESTFSNLSSKHEIEAVYTEKQFVTTMSVKLNKLPIEQEMNVIQEQVKSLKKQLSLENQKTA
jgi:hypothetical protein